MRNLKPAPVSNHNKSKTFCYKDLHTCTHIFLRQDAVKQGLDLPYSGPHKVISRLTDKIFKIDLNGKEINLKIERLKPPHLLTAENTGDNQVTTVPMQQPQSLNGSTPNQSSTSNTNKPIVLRTYPGPNGT